MLVERWAALEARCRREAPSVADELRSLLTYVVGTGLSEAVPGGSVALPEPSTGA